jgi:hypothetical protein
MKSALKRQSGAAMVELAIVLPLYIMLIGGIIEFGNALMQFNILNKAAMDASRYLSIYAEQGAGTYSISSLQFKAEKLLQCGKVPVSPQDNPCVNDQSDDEQSFLPLPAPTIIDTDYTVDANGVITFPVTYTYQPLFNSILGTAINPNFTFNSTIVVQAL